MEEYEMKLQRVKAWSTILRLTFYASQSSRDGKKIRTRRGPDPQIRFDWGIPELTGDGDGDGESPNYKTGDGGGDGDNKNPRPQTRTRTFNV